MEMRTGDVICGTPLKVAGKSILLRMRDLDGDVAFPLKRVITLIAPAYGPSAARDVTAPPDADVILFKQGDSLKGFFNNIDASSISFGTESSPTPTDIPLNNVDRVIFGGARPPRDIPALAVRFTFSSGTIMTVPLDKPDTFKWVLGKVTLKDSAGVSHEGGTSQFPRHSLARRPGP
jgi:hypothetical protein